MFYRKNTSNAEFQIHGEHVLSFLESTPEALSRLAQYGMGAVQLQEGRNLFSEVLMLAQQVRDLRRKQVAATDSFHQDWKHAKQCYQVHLQAARRVLGRDAQQLLLPMPARYAEWVEHARSFYQAMLGNPNFQAALATVNVTVDDLARVNEMLTNVATGKKTQMLFHSNMRLSLKQRNLLIRKSKRWFEVLLSTARVAFAEEPALLAALAAAAVRSEAEKEATRKLMAERRAAKKLAAQPAIEI